MVLPQQVKNLKCLNASYKFSQFVFQTRCSLAAFEGPVSLKPAEVPPGEIFLSSYDNWPGGKSCHSPLQESIKPLILITGTT